jgi:hypothetical protein
VTLESDTDNTPIGPAEWRAEFASLCAMARSEGWNLAKARAEMTRLPADAHKYSVRFDEAVASVSAFLRNEFPEECAAERDRDPLTEANDESGSSELTRKSPLRSFTGADLHTRALALPPRDLIVEPYLGKYESVFLYGPKGHGKTWVAAGTAMVGAQGHGARCLNFAAPPDAPGIPTLYVDGEMFTRDLDQRIQDLRRSSPGLDPGDNLFWWTPDAQDDEHTILNLFEESGRRMLEDHIEDIRKETGKVIGQLFFDNMSSLLWGWEENKQESWAKIAPWLLELRARKIGNYWVHHANREGGYRGNSAMIGAMHAILNVQHPDDWTADQGARFDFKYEWTRAKPSDLFNFNAHLEFAEWTVTGERDSLDDQIVDAVHEDPTLAKKATQLAKQLGLKDPGKAGKHKVRRALTRLQRLGGRLAVGGRA